MRGTGAFPGVFEWWAYVVEPTAPIVPRDKDRRRRPVFALPQQRDTVNRPLHARLDTGGRVLVKFHGGCRRIEPGDIRQRPGGYVSVEFGGEGGVWAAAESGDVVEICGMGAIAAPCKPGLGEGGGQRRQIEGGLRLIGAARTHIVNEG